MSRVVVYLQSEGLRRDPSWWKPCSSGASNARGSQRQAVAVAKAGVVAGAVAVAGAEVEAVGAVTGKAAG